MSKFKLRYGYPTQNLLEQLVELNIDSKLFLQLQVQWTEGKNF